MTTRQLVGDVLDRLAALPDASVQCALTSPPYLQLRDYGLPPSRWPDGWVGCLGQEPSVDLYIRHLVTVFGAVRRVLRRDGILVVNVGDSYAGSGRGPTGHNGIGNQTRRQGFEASDLSERRSGRGIRSDTGYELHEPPAMPGLKPKDLMLVPERLAIAMQEDGWYVRSRIAWCKGTAMPESVQDRPTSAWEHVWLFSKSRRYYWDQEAVKQPSRSEHGSGNGYARPERLSVGGRGQSEPWHAQPFSTLRNFWVLGPEPSRYDYCGGCDSFYLGAERKTIERTLGVDGRMQRRCPSCGSTTGWVGHFAAFPTELARRVILATTSEHGACGECGAPWARVMERGQSDYARLKGERTLAELRTEGAARGWPDHHNGGNTTTTSSGTTPSLRSSSITTTGWRPTCRCTSAGVVPCTVLDPFMGSGTTALAARHLGRDAIGIELRPEYARLAEHRVEREIPKWARPVPQRRSRVTHRPAPLLQMPLEAVS